MDEIRDGGRLVYGDILASSDWTRSLLKDHSSCATCGSPMPMVIEGRFCSDCTDENAEGFRATREARLTREAA